MRVKGAVGGGTNLTVNGREIVLDNGQFDENFMLKPGGNVLTFVSRDLVGNTASVEKHVLCDTDAPEVAGYEISPKNVVGGETVRVNLTAKDATGYVRAVPYKIKIGAYEHSGFLILTEEKGKYTDSFNLPKNTPGKPKLKAVKLSDYAGNEKEYRF